MRALRRGLPRVKGGEPWPPGEALAPSSSAALRRGLPRVTGGEPWPVASTPAPAAVPAPEPPSGSVVLRRGLPRAKGGEAWPAAGEVAVGVALTPSLPHAAPLEHAEATPAVIADPVPTVDPPLAAVPIPPTTATPTTPTSTAPTSNAPTPSTPHTPSRRRRTTAALPTAAALLLALAAVVLLVRWLRGLPAVAGFLADYPGAYPLPVGAPVGFPAWVGWQHFFNVFLMVLIIRSGLQIRTEKRPAVFWSPRWNPGRKISLRVWFHQSLDLLWLVNGVLFVVLLFATGQWLRVVPTSWAVFPNALSAALQYASLHWPTEDGWANYNALQQLTYFATVFLAAPLAAITGVRMSGIWPARAKRLSRAYPIEWARAVHFPVMLYFVLFIVVHVTLVLATGALRNLNHMYGGSDRDDWTGFWLFAASLLVIAAAWVAARPLVIAPIARLFGKVGR